AGGRFAWTTLLLREALVAEAFLVTVFLLTVFLPAAFFGAVEDPVDATLATTAFLLVLPVFLTTAAFFFAGIVRSPALPAFGQSRSYTRRYWGPQGDRVTAPGAAQAVRTTTRWRRRRPRARPGSSPPAPGWPALRQRQNRGCGRCRRATCAAGCRNDI